MADSNVLSIAEHKDTLCTKADRAIGLAMQLRSALRECPSMPLPDAETDILIHALAVFVAAAERYPR